MRPKYKELYQKQVKETGKLIIEFKEKERELEDAYDKVDEMQELYDERFDNVPKLFRWWFKWNY